MEGYRGGSGKCALEMTSAHCIICLVLIFRGLQKLLFNRDSCFFGRWAICWLYNIPIPENFLGGKTDPVGWILQLIQFLTVKGSWHCCSHYTGYWLWVCICIHASLPNHWGLVHAWVFQDLHVIIKVPTKVTLKLPLKMNGTLSCALQWMWSWLQERQIVWHVHVPFWTIVLMI